MSVADCKKGAAQRVLDVADESVDSIEFGDFDALQSASDDNHAMIMTSVFNGVEVAQPHRRLRGNQAPDRAQRAELHERSALHITEAENSTGASLFRQRRCPAENRRRQ